jgi:hypothetical protein
LEILTNNGSNNCSVLQSIKTDFTAHNEAVGKVSNTLISEA